MLIFIKLFDYTLSFLILSKSLVNRKSYEPFRSICQRCFGVGWCCSCYSLKIVYNRMAATFKISHILISSSFHLQNNSFRSFLSSLIERNIPDICCVFFWDDARFRQPLVAWREAFLTIVIENLFLYFWTRILAVIFNLLLLSCHRNMFSFRWIWGSESIILKSLVKLEINLIYRAYLLILDFLLLIHLDLLR